jgi:hypothetical protein
LGSRRCPWRSHSCAAEDRYRKDRGRRRHTALSPPNGLFERRDPNCPKSGCARLTSLRRAASGRLPVSLYLAHGFILQPLEADALRDHHSVVTSIAATSALDRLCVVTELLKYRAANYASLSLHRPILRSLPKKRPGARRPVPAQVGLPRPEVSRGWLVALARSRGDVP